MGWSLESGKPAEAEWNERFSDYMRPPIRLAALIEQRVIFVFTHDP